MSTAVEYILTVSGTFWTVQLPGAVLSKCRESGRHGACSSRRTYCFVPFLISNFRHVLNAVCFLLGNSPASEFYMPTFRNTLFHLHRQVGMKNV